jgi:hypothetical protein
MSPADGFITQVGVIINSDSTCAVFVGPRSTRKNKNMSLLRLLRPTLPILIGASLMLSLSMGLRQSLSAAFDP